MDADNEKRPDERAPTPPRSEGVRIIGADEAATALETGQAEGRRPDDAPRFGDVPNTPTVSEPPAARFPLPNAVDPSDVRRAALAGPTDLPHWTDPPTGEVPAVLGASGPPGSAVPGEDDDLAAWSGFTGAGGARWRDHPRDWEDAGMDEAFQAAPAAGDDPLSALEVTEADELYGFDDPDLIPVSSRPGVGGAAKARPRHRWARGFSHPPRSGRRSGVGVQEGYPPPGWLDDGGEAPDPEAPGGSAPGGRPSGVATRLVSGIGIGVVVLLVAQAGPLALLVVCAVITLVASAEGYAALHRAHYRPAALLGLTASVAALLGAYYRGEQALPLVAALMTVFTLLWYLAGVVRSRPVANAGATIAMFMWAGFLASYAGLLLDPSRFPDRHGVAFLLAAVIATVGYDVGGFAVGRWIGRRPLAPAISPNKTWEGLIGGMLVCLLVSAGIVSQIAPWDLKRAIALGALAAVVAPLGDLCQSMIKRDLGLKDMGSILPGHGGLLDRVDALLFVLPATYYLVRALGIG